MKHSEAALGLFLTKGNSLASWDAVGMLDREVAYYKLIAEQVRHVFIFSYGRTDARQYAGIFGPNVSIIDKPFGLPNFLYQFLLPFLQWRNVTHCDILKTNQLYAAVPAIFAKFMRPRKKLIVRCGYAASLNAVLYRHPLLSRLYTNALERLAVHAADLVFITTEENAGYLGKRYPFAKKKIAVIPNAIDTNLFRPQSEQEQYTIGYVGRLNQDKNLRMLLEAAVGLDASLCFIGQGLEQNSLESFAREHHIRLTIIPRVQNSGLPAYYNRFRLFVFPSLHEGSPKTLLEAMACGRPVIACDVVGVNKVITSEKNGILVQPNTFELARAIRKLHADRVLQKQLGTAARNYIIQNHDLHYVVAKKEMKFMKIP